MEMPARVAGIGRIESALRFRLSLRLPDQRIQRARCQFRKSSNSSARTSAAPPGTAVSQALPAGRDMKRLTSRSVW